MKTSRIDTPEAAAVERGSAAADATGEAVEQTDATPEPHTNDEAGERTDDAAEPETKGEADAGADVVATDAKSPRGSRSISVGVRSLVIAAVIAVLAGAVGTLAWLYLGAQDKLDAQASQSAANARAEKMALDYAVNAATMDFKDLQGWKVKLVAGTSPELNKKLTEAGKEMEQVLVPLEWNSTAKPLVAKVRSSTDGRFVVDCFVSVQTKTVQAPDALQSTATYSLTIDSNKDWQITDVGGIGSVIEPK